MNACGNIQSVYSKTYAVSEEMEGKPKVLFETNGHLLVL